MVERLSAIIAAMEPIEREHAAREMPVEARFGDDRTAADLADIARLTDTTSTIDPEISRLAALAAQESPKT